MRVIGGHVGGQRDVLASSGVWRLWIGELGVMWKILVFTELIGCRLRNRRIKGNLSHYEDM